MATERQIAANRKNAKRSTGPITQEGKAASRSNAQTHGLSGATLLLMEGEDPEQFSELRQALFSRFTPADALGIYLVEVLTGTIWRLKRAYGFEAMLIEWKKHEQSMEDSQPISVFDEGLLDLTIPRDENAEPLEDKSNGLGRALEAAFTEGDLLAKLARHETHLTRQAERIIDTLRKLQNENSIAA